MELVNRNQNQNQQLSSSSIKIEDIKTWVSTAITNQETCLDGLDETQRSDLLSQMKNAMKNSTEFSSNSLAIVAKIIKVIDDLSLPPPNNHNRRKLLGRRREFPFPMWVNSANRRRLLDEEAMSPDVTVAIDGSGNYKSIGEAVAAVGKKNKTRTV
ncbi:Pectinesterase [Thalictrum thalictroides]|uniref:Pectinesterase n=1 Tax=Thalictrum thalictroides TaxID=46969 RepID=A0A7J6UVH9_THATH|nr:Pectinesterase [Thalictrum thalictroides]